MNPVVHFEMPAEDRNRMADFYTGVFGWKAQLLGEDMGNYVMVSTSETDAQGRPTSPGTINGGFFPQMPDAPKQHPSLVIAVDNIHDAIALIKKNGGEVLGEPVAIPGVGDYVSFIDTEGNKLSILKPLM